MRYEEFVKKIMEEYVKKGTIPVGAFPDMELYMDQTVLFMNRKLDIYRKDPKEPVITKTMIGNYAKHDLIPRPVNKRYTRDHLLLLTLIFHLKGTFQMQEIELLMKPLIDNYNSAFDEKFDFGQIYEGVMDVFAEEREKLADQVDGQIGRIKDMLGLDEFADDDTTELFMLIASLALQADARKYLAQKLLAEYFVKPKKK
ncbi:DUF1836 domain-containing protein [Bacilliculturomica massiliensis]|uniref:DUF1836 domain-containing protein n=1 Tax=Bacilliculturomica massiliensis TaxID=1917867 RepID=UPI001031113E|nr:DUF1836 domain-containing protein [Bacilliculturomica massiliensis]